MYVCLLGQTTPGRGRVRVCEYVVFSQHIRGMCVCPYVSGSTSLGTVHILR